MCGCLGVFEFDGFVCEWKSRMFAPGDTTKHESAQTACRNQCEAIRYTKDQLCPYLDDCDSDDDDDNDDVDDK